MNQEPVSHQEARQRDRQLGIRVQLDRSVSDLAEDDRTILVGKPCDPSDVARTLQRLGLTAVVKKAS